MAPVPAVMVPAVMVALVMVAMCIPVLAAAAVVAEVMQHGRAFSDTQLTVVPGTLVRFINGDEFPHQVHVSGPGLLFDSDLQEPGNRTEVAFPVAGTFQVRCGIHPRMRMTVTARAQP